MVAAHSRECDCPFCVGTFLRLVDITVDHRIQIRESLNEDTVERYMEVLAELPPVIVFSAGGRNLLADGFHRAEAARRLGHETIDVDLRPGDRADAEEYAVVANTRHGQPLTKAERNEGIRRLISKGWTQERIADEMGVARSSVDNIGDALRLRGLLPPEPTYRPSGAASRVVNPLPAELLSAKRTDGNNRPILTDSHLYKIATLPADKREPVARMVVQEQLTEPQMRTVIAQVKNNQPVRIPTPEPKQPREAVEHVIREVRRFFDRTIAFNGQELTYREVIRTAIDNPDAIQLRDTVAPTASLAVDLADALNDLHTEALGLASPLLLTAGGGE